MFAVGAGPLFDIGPYYLTALAHLWFGYPYATVAAVGASRVVRRAGAASPVTGRAPSSPSAVAPTLVQAIASFTGGQVAQNLFSFDSPMARMGYVEITGTEGTLLAPDPNLFGGAVCGSPIRSPSYTVQSETEWSTCPCPTTYGRRAGAQAFDLARCICGGVS
ncbi:MAG: hypothetical protein R2742_12865 [Micropruina glycogenica]